uniref:Uncharacterized protein n=1 Tax=Pelusios castaneus TaxID=367368 RepID=A0A8C8SPS2_9SAUR
MADVENILLEVNAGRCVGIQINNNTRDVILESPKTYCFSGHVQKDPEPKIQPGSSGSCVFVKTSYSARGSVGVLSYESDVFTLAILFSNPFDRILYNSEFAIEVFPDRKHFYSMESLYQYMNNHRPPYQCESFARMELKVETKEKELRVSSQEIQVNATMSDKDKAIIKVQIEEKNPCPPYTAYPGATDWNARKQ